MLESILRKLGFKTVQEFLDSEKAFIKQNMGDEVDRPNPFLKLSGEERHYFQRYVLENKLI